jgi:hypothetical protein
MSLIGNSKNGRIADKKGLSVGILTIMIFPLTASSIDRK